MGFHTSPLRAAVCVIALFGGGFAQAFAQSSSSETFWFDSRNSGPASSQMTLRPGVAYRVDIDGTYTVWSTLGAGGGCGAPEPSPIYGSGHNNGAAFDAEYIFAAPTGSNWCAGLPYRQSYIKINYGSGWLDPQPASVAGVTSNHSYGYYVTGQGAPLRIQLNDSYYPDNAGRLRIRIRTAATTEWRSAGCNVDSYRADDAILGAPWSAEVDLSSTGHSSAWLRGYAIAATLPIGALGCKTLLADVSSPLLMQAKPSQLSASLATFEATLPNDPALIAVQVFTQAVHIGPGKPFALSNAQDLTIGY